MRKLCFLFCLLACILGAMLYANDGQAEASLPLPDGPAPAAAHVQDTVKVQVVFPTMTPAPSAQPTPSTAPAMLTVYDEGRCVRMEMEEYLVHVVAGEMPASYEEEALKAQAVAARSYVSWKQAAWGGSGCSKGVDTDICTDSTHCMAYLSDEAMREKWGERYEEYYDRIRSAVLATQGEVMLYDGSPIQALFHSSSGGRTEDAQAVWGAAFPYLQSVSSGAEEESGQTRAEKRFKIEALVKALNQSFTGAELTAQNVEEQFSIRSYTASGRADVVKVGKVTATGRAVRTALGLNSTNFSVAYKGGEAVFTTVGYGHGVGMSQVGANLMAKEGSDYQEILTHYYTHVTLGPLPEAQAN